MKGKIKDAINSTNTYAYENMNHLINDTLWMGFVCFGRSLVVLVSSLAGSIQFILCSLVFNVFTFYTTFELFASIFLLLASRYFYWVRVFPTDIHCPEMLPISNEYDCVTFITFLYVKFSVAFSINWSEQ